MNPPVRCASVVRHAKGRNAHAAPPSGVARKPANPDDRHLARPVTASWARRARVGLPGARAHGRVRSSPPSWAALPARTESQTLFALATTGCRVESHGSRGARHRLSRPREVARRHIGLAGARCPRVSPRLVTLVALDERTR